jgi:hypothetical protein
MNATDNGPETLDEAPLTRDSPRGATPAAAAQVARATAGAAMASNALRDDDAARAAFNHPAHWRVAADGGLAPDDARLEAESARGWAAITGKFGDALAPSMFDANVRGGAMAVISVMDAAASRRTLTVRDLATLQFTAVASGGARAAGVAVPAPPTLRDAAYSIAGCGVSMHQQIHGKQFCDATIGSLFGIEPEIVVSRHRPLGLQLAAALQLSQRIDVRFANVLIHDLLSEIRPLFMRCVAGGWQLLHRWNETSAANAHRAEQLLDANGLLAHLTPAARHNIMKVVYGPRRLETFEAIAKRWAQSGDLAQFTHEVANWLDDLAARLRSASRGSLMSREEFTQRAAEATALGLLIDRAAPGLLASGLRNIGVGEADLPPVLQCMDLRTDYPRVLDDVQRALGLPA